ncbi:hypothetical protein [Alkalisalibacterium limincola]|uniref:Tetratricopeptide repeat protein n=1 Tax=Alkalisalibacterium limincola TaxID=2699169 RepID=A0A5C8KXV4_9GAMM|nr:hypothetical protein [Alkalisalibacterium limincola]TXK65607.1 hypothetical protein FU658_00255 [Alkalisalibacterium limincola]
MRTGIQSALGVVVVGVALAVGVALLVRGPGLGSDAQVASARAALAAGQLDAAQAGARAALGQDPTSVDALVVLAEVAIARDDLEAAQALHGEAARRSQRAVTSHAWLASRLGGQGDVAGALHHVDVLLRGHFNLRDSLYPALAQLLDSAAGVEALAGRLAEAPAWRLGFLSHVGRDADTRSEAVLALYSALEHTPNPPTLQERQPLLQRLVGEGRYRQAWLMFVATLDGPGIAELGNVFNGGFELDSSGLPFDWQFGRVAGAVIEQVQAVDDDGERSRRLRIEFLNRRVPFNHVGQLLLLDPGEYRLEGRVRLESLANPRGLQWVIHCAPAPGTELLRSERFSGTRAWGRFGEEFSVPAEGCEAQWLRLQIPARIDSERQVSGRAWFDAIAIHRAARAE